MARKPSAPFGPIISPFRSICQVKLKKKSRTISPKASVATTSIRPFTRSAGKPTTQATAAVTRPATSIAGRM